MIVQKIRQKFRRHTDVYQGIFMKDDGKSASRFGIKTSDGLYVALPLSIITFFQ